MLKNWENKHFLSWIRTTLSTVGFLCLLVIFSLLPNVFSSSVFATDYSLTISTDDVEIDIDPGESTAQSSDINVVTTCKAGYNLVLSTSNNDNHLYLNGDSSNNGANMHFDPSDGTTALSSATNTWGYSLDIPSNTTPVVYSAPTSSNVFLPVPSSSGVPATLKTTKQTASNTTIDDEFSIYYGVNASSSLTGGTYRMKNDTGTNNPGSLVYYVTMNPLCATELDLTFNQNLDGLGGEGTDNTLVNFPVTEDNTADIVHSTYTLSSKVPARNNYIFTEWNTEADGTGSSYQPGDTIHVGDGTNELTGTVTLYAIWEAGQAYVVTLDYTEHDIKNIEFYHDTYTTQYVDEDGGIVVLRPNENYSFIIDYENGYKTDTITTTANGTIGNTTVKGITYSVTGNATITITSAEKTGTTTLETGTTLNGRMKTLANGGTSVGYSTASSKIKALRMASFLPSDFTASTANTVSVSGSAKPVYIFFDNANDAGIMYFYTEAKDVYMNANSSNAFYNNTALSNISALANWDTGSVTNMSSMFACTYSLADISALANWSTSNVRSMAQIFQSTYSLTDISALSNWNTGNVTNMYQMFYSAYSLTDISALASWNTGSVTNVSYMFNSAYSLTDIFALANWNTSNVTSMNNMFSSAYSLTDISALASWNTGSVTNMSYMFSNTYSLTDISALASWNTGSVTNISYMFSNAYSLTDISALADWNTGSVTNMSYMFQYAYSLTDISALADWNTGSVTNMGGMFFGTYSLTDISALASWNTGSVTDMSSMFSNTYSLTDISALANWNTSSVTSMNNMFLYAFSLTDVSAIDNWNIGAVAATAGSSSSSSNKFYQMFKNVPAHPNFTKRLGTWNSDGTFVTDSAATVTVTVALDSHVKGVSFHDNTYGTRTVTTNGDTIVIPSGATQDISILGYDDGYTLRGWSTDNGSLGNNGSDPTTYTTSVDDTLTVDNATANTSTVTISPDAHFSSIIFKSPKYGTKTITSADINNNNNTVSLANNVDYDIIVNYENGYGTNSITTTANGTIDNTAITVQGIPYTITGNDTLTITSSQKTGTATLDTGSTLNGKIKTLAEGRSVSYSVESSKIKALRMASFLPSGFTPSSANTVSPTNSAKPVYIFFDNTNDAGIMYFYTEAHDVYMDITSDHAFHKNTALSDISALASWNTSRVTNMGSMFDSTYSLTDISALANWNTGSVTNMSYIFSYAYSLNDISALANWNTSSVTNMSYMFYYAYSLTDISALASWNTSSVTNMSYMFQYAYSLTDISAFANWNTSRLAYMSYIFSYAYSLNDISALASWNTGSVTNMSYMFQYAYSLTDISALASWNTGSVTNVSYMFNSAYSLTDISALASWNTSRVTNMSYIFGNAYSLTDISALANWNTGSVTNMSSMFNYAYSLTDISALANWNTGNVTSMYYMFAGVYSLVDISALASWNTGSVTNMSYMFSGAYSLVDVFVINDWDVRAVTATAGSTSSSSNKFYYMFNKVPSHPNFTMRAGNWNSDGTFIPSS